MFMIAFDEAREMERRASFCYADGLLDIGIGLGLLFLGLTTLVGLGALAGVYLAVLVPIVRAAKRSVTVPRMHHLDFMPEPGAESRSRRLQAVLVASMAVLIALGVLALFMSRMIPAHISSWLRSNAIVIFGALLAALFILIGWGTSTRRARRYAFVTIIALVLGYWFDLNPVWYFVLIGAVVLSWGSVTLNHFVRDFPRMHERNGKVYQRTY